MNRFKDFGIKLESKNLIGEKIKPERIINKIIIVEDFRVEASKYDNGEGKKCLYLQIKVDGSSRVTFIGSQNLISMIQQVPKDKFPFETIISKENERLEFT
jgi:hypothetical protein